MPSYQTLIELADLVSPEEEAKEHLIPCTNTGEYIAADRPLYFAKYKEGRDGEEKTIVATEEEVL